MNIVYLSEAHVVLPCFSNLSVVTVAPWRQLPIGLPMSVLNVRTAALSLSGLKNVTQPGCSYLA